MKKIEVFQSQEWKYKSYQLLVKWYDINSLFYFHQIYTDFIANNKINRFSVHFICKTVNQTGSNIIFIMIIGFEHCYFLVSSWYNYWFSSVRTKELDGTHKS